MGDFSAEIAVGDEGQDCDTMLLSKCKQPFILAACYIALYIFDGDSRGAEVGDMLIMLANACIVLFVLRSSMPKIANNEVSALRLFCRTHC